MGRALALGRPGRAVWLDLLQGTMLQTQTSDETDGRGSREPKLRPTPTGSPPFPLQLLDWGTQHQIISCHRQMATDMGTCAHFWGRVASTLF